MQTNLLKSSLSILLVSGVLSGCATTSNGDAVVHRENWPWCALIGAAAGGGLGAIESSTAAAYGAGLGLLAGSLICYALDGDQDADGVHDRRDRCPDTPAGTEVYPNGCAQVLNVVAEPAPVAEPQDEVIVLDAQILFGFDSAELTADAQDLLAEIATRISGADVISVNVHGHTDSVGSDAYNMGLSERRARTVADQLIAQGVAAEKVSIEGFGESKPVASNDTEEGRASNRRVEIHVDR
jgi:outer membrane protein OmpA-like peptidoglycan-associated protein